MKNFIALLIMSVSALNLFAGKMIVVPKDFPTIRGALESAEPGDTVFVQKGIYKESVILKDGVALIGESVASTIIHGTPRKPVVKGADKAVIRNFTIENGLKGILCENVAMVIENNCVRGNKETGIHCLVSLPVVRNNVVIRNKNTGIFCETVRSLNSDIDHNVVAENGYSGIVLAGTSQVLVQNNVFVNNKQYGIWVNVGAKKSRITHNNFYMNRNNYNFFAQVDNTNISVDPGYGTAGDGSDIFTGQPEILQKRASDGMAIGIINAQEVRSIGQDKDRDGIPDDKDQCSTIPEDLDGFQDEDGCPDFDNDSDGIYDTQDKCPNEAEDKEGFQDEDGCPDLDNDADGVLDPVDVCPNSPETMNGYKDDDGCPDELPIPDKK